jgi:hypothetical protein
MNVLQRHGLYDHFLLPDLNSSCGQNEPQLLHRFRCIKSQRTQHFRPAGDKWKNRIFLPLKIILAL